MEDDNKKVEETEEKPKSLIDRFWWVIPPVFITFVYLPYFYNIYNLKLHISFESYMLIIKYLYIDKYGGSLFWLYFLFGFMTVGMLLTKKRSLILRIIIPIIFPILAQFIVLLVFVIWLKIGSLNYPL